MSDYDDLLRLARQRRTSRGYVEDAVSLDTIQDILEVARWAPSAANTQPWEFVVITDRDIKEKIRDAFLNEALEHSDKRYRRVTEEQAKLLIEPVLIGVCGKPASRERFVNASELSVGSQDELFLLSMGAMIQNLLLAATASGLDSTWIARLARVPEVVKILQIPDELQLIAFVTVGTSSQKLTAHEGRRVPITEKVHLNRYGTSFKE